MIHTRALARIEGSACLTPVVSPPASARPQQIAVLRQSDRRETLVASRKETLRRVASFPAVVPVGKAAVAAVSFPPAVLQVGPALQINATFYNHVMETVPLPVLKQYSEAFEYIRVVQTDWQVSGGQFDISSGKILSGGTFGDEEPQTVLSGGSF